MGIFFESIDDGKYWLFRAKIGARGWAVAIIVLVALLFAAIFLPDTLVANLAGAGLSLFIILCIVMVLERILFAWVLPNNAKKKGKEVMGNIDSGLKIQK